MKPTEVHIRPARPEDIPEMTALLKMLFAIEKDFAIDAERQERGLAMLLDSGSACLLAAEAEGRVVGMVSGQLVISTAEGGPSLWAEDLVVEPGWRGRGVGRRLMEAVAHWAREQGAPRLQHLADQGNQRGLAFHRSLGYQTTRMICMRKSQDLRSDHV